jgi:hypothetical protein
MVDEIHTTPNGLWKRGVALLKDAPTIPMPIYAGLLTLLIDATKAWQADLDGCAANKENRGG